ncbi:MAG: hypothetical protein IKN87_05425 [Bacilli bacterium]|nr:hypothetical protein [Bacilli bacterium]
MGRKCYKMYVNNNFTGERTAIFNFDEKDGKGFETKAHSSTIDKFTVLYDNTDKLLNAFNNSKTNNGILIDCNSGHIDVFSSDLIITHNINGKEVIESPLYSCYKAITEIPVKDFAYCDTNSREFENFFKLFLSRIRNDAGFYYEATHSDYYNDNFIDNLIGYRESIDREKSYNLIRKQLGGYAMMRKAYKDVIKNDMIHLKK